MIALTGPDSPSSGPAPAGEPDGSSLPEAGPQQPGLRHVGRDPEDDHRASDTPGSADAPTSGPTDVVYPRRRDLRASGKEYVPDDPNSGPVPETAEDAEAEAPQKDYGKAGRNLPAAIGIGLLLGGAVLASLIIFPTSFLFIILVAIVAAMWELGNALSRSGSLVSRVPTVVAAACMVVATYFGGREALWVTFVAGAGAVMLFTMVERRKNAVKDVSLSLFALTYVGLMACFVVFLLTEPDGNLYVILFLASVVASDTGGYIFGVVWGKHPIAPSISPKKSWEGYLGSVVFTTAVAVILALTVFGAPFWTGFVIGVIIPAFATLGDFSESMIKRDLDLKDMGTLLPGHGGVMDRLDSILPTAPVALVLFSVLPGYL
ncbi:phosphatidate cytidylyltransferase [Brevibacterium sanguinis]|uniref:Phosphatidate cytidylyltransferase n=2 Tax=Brevibacterium TaxID=1696 RepID=A0A366INN9_9MICO|nr:MULTISPECIES: phosphatidate cytidylyltransferase [Brevibacterium]RBP67905.1 phosphatidate cytidylyltransferase [Brevibacterium sanguinis]RBP74678.1 phosphatidate cytidylyltransferase [Brevibacterium celere]